MNITKAIAAGMLLWVLIFFEISILMFGFQLDKTTINYIHYIVAIILVTIASLMYFNKKKSKKGFLQGILLGVTFVVVGLILDALITVPLFVKSYVFFIDPYMLIGWIETIIIAAIIGALKK